jgi:hypothetical protein
MMSPIGLRQFHDVVPLPLPENDEISFYYFLAQASLRKLLIETLDIVGYKSESTSHMLMSIQSDCSAGGRVIHAPIVTSELRKQVTEWYAHLPPAIRFPLDSTPLFDLRKSYLRGQYFCLFILMGWPPVLSILEAGEHEVSADASVTAEQAKQCISSCALLLTTAEEMLSRRNLGSQLMVWACYAALTELILTYNAPALAFAPETRTDEHIRNGYDMLLAWNHLPVMRRGLIRTRSMMATAGIEIGGDRQGG